MGEPDPLDLELIQNGENREIDRAIDELELMSFARSVAFEVIGSRYPADVGEVANDSMELLFTRAIHTCRTIDNIRPMLAKIAKRQAINFLKVAFRQQELLVGDQIQDFLVHHNDPGVDPLESLGDFLALDFGWNEFTVGNVMDLLIEGDVLTVIEQNLLQEHVIGGCTQDEFSRRHGIPLRGIGGRKDRLIKKIIRFIACELEEESLAEFLQILRRNQR